MTDKMYDNLQGKYKNSVFQILKICKAFGNFDFNSTIKKKIHWVVQLLENKVIESFSLTTRGFFVRKPFFCLSLNFLKIMLEIRLKFS